MISCLRGKAREILEYLSNDELNDYNRIVNLLDQEISDEHFARMHYNILEYRVRKDNESIAVIGEEIKKLTRLAFPSILIESREKVACSQFIRGIRNRKIEYELRAERINSFRTAIERATELDAINSNLQINFESLNENKRKFVPDSAYESKIYTPHASSSSSLTNSNKRPKIHCHYCKLFGHYANECRKLNPNANPNNQSQKYSI